MTHTNSGRNNFTRDLLSYMAEKLSGYQMVQREYKNKLRIKFEPVEITFYPVRHFKINI